MRSRLGRPLLTLMCRYVRRQWEAYRHYRKRSATTAEDWLRHVAAMTQ